MLGKHLAKGFIEAIVVVFASFIGGGFGYLFSLSRTSPGTVELTAVYYIIAIALVFTIPLVIIKSYIEDKLRG